ncbi:MAG: hypothetical protein R3E01_30545 [Pirellulaceae bacterium]
MSIANLIAGRDIAIDGYLITADGAALDPSAWSSFQDTVAGGWQESNPGDNHLGELNLSGARVVSGESEVSLGNSYLFTPNELGEAAPTINFSYHVDGLGTVPGIVEYTGFTNNVVLLVDPNTGAAAIQNQSPFFDRLENARQIWRCFRIGDRGQYRWSRQ